MQAHEIRTTGNTLVKVKIVVKLKIELKVFQFSKDVVKFYVHTSPVFSCQVTNMLCLKYLYNILGESRWQI